MSIKTWTAASSRILISKTRSADRLLTRMKCFAILCLLSTLALARGSPGGFYTDRYDNINLDEILANKRLLIPYIKCILDQGRCTPEALELKSHIAEALENNCAKCTPAQRNGTRQVMSHLINKEPGYWRQLTQKYDPTNKYTLKYEKDLRSVTVA